MILRRTGRASTTTPREFPPNNDDATQSEGPSSSSSSGISLFEQNRTDGIDSPTNESITRLWCNYLRRLRPSFAIHLGFNLESRYDWKRRIRPASFFLGGALFMGTTIFILIITLQLHAFVVEYQGPLDHVDSFLLEPYYGMFCPVFSTDNEEKLNDNESTNLNSTTLLSWDCNDIIQNIIKREQHPTTHENALSISFPRIFMIGARDDNEDTFRAWNLELHRISAYSSDRDSGISRRVPRLERINTLEISNLYALSGGARGGRIPRRRDGRGGAPLPQSTAFTDTQLHLNSTSMVEASSYSNTLQKASDGRQDLCRKIKWEHRLFAVYQSIFTNLLSNYPNDSGFVLVEDDAVLKNPHYFMQEVCKAHFYQLQFYSLYRSPSQWRGRSRTSSSCIYQHGTVAFYIRRSVMERIVNERRRAYFCRFPIDMYISKLGPWYSTRREVVGHSETGRIGSTS
jgi:hypothetical protein